MQQIDVREFRIEGSSLLATTRLQTVVAPFAGRSLTTSQMQQAADAVTQAYRTAGYTLVQALILPQSINDGIVVITVREDRLAGVQVIGERTPSLVQRSIQETLTPQQALNVNALEQILLLVNDLPGRGRASAEIIPPTQGDASNVTVRYAPAPKVQGSATIDTSGNRYTGSTRLIGQMLINEPFNSGDQLSLTVLSAGTPLTYAQAGYRFPLTPRLSMGVSLSVLEYELCCQAAGITFKGAAQSFGFDAAYQLNLKRGENSALYAALDSRRLKSERNGIEQSNRQIDALSAGIRGYTTVGTFRSWNTSLRAGRADLQNNAGDLAQNATTQIQGSFSKLTGGFYQSLNLTHSWLWLLQTRGQLNLGRNLDGSERIALGGADGVRAYPSGEGVGDTGWLLSTELRYAIEAAQGLSLAAFVDAGGVRRYSRNVAPVLAMMNQKDNTYTLAGAGVGVRYDSASTSLVLQIAKPIGNNRGVDTSGNNNEGRRDGQTQAWLSAAWKF
ncbi:ShlB/FhaC/HecB family hemolysin secretion/activation protein [Variovorax sp. PCZ-1]|uniref:ShlB/FhaC/HecB family hemolysin secretion/activation protein n=1 Tax=Variovorax sp. PCZ-1 TaxID=2835533 RepID=UPI001BCF3F84|nr:ShlB/FhaC/HecB family hemolysin secretion/activation protein [Variovorax sp. PCZ-1]MBS7807637.1 ShlB/FhaC/HecB family hemolysin secretion/activation protein [Variovorax sp. PCZ-1]